jgi:hypothetical protein
LKMKQMTTGIEHDVSAHVRGADAGPFVEEK